MDSMDDIAIIADRHTLFGTAAATATIVFSLAYWWLKPKPLDEFPHNPITSILGDIPEIARAINSGKNILDYFDILVKRHGLVVQILIGNQISLLVSDRAEVERLVASKNLDIASTINAVWSPLMPTGQISLPTNNMWRHHRRILGPSMHRRYLSRMTNHVSNSAKLLMKLWSVKLDIAQGKSFGVELDLRQATMDSIATIAIGSSLGSIENAIHSVSVGSSGMRNALDITTGDPKPVFRAIDKLISYAGQALQLPFPSVTIPIYMRLSPTWHRDSNLVRAFLLDNIVAARRREDHLDQSKELMTDTECIVDMLMQQEVREGSEALSTNELIDELMAMFVAGQETTASALAWFVKYMSTDPEIQHRLHDEVCSVFGKSSDDATTMTLNILSNTEKVPVLEAVATETLRCAQVGGALLRRLLDDDVVMGRRVPKHVSILIPTGYLGTKESDWGPDAKEWRPSRWLRPDGSFDRNAGPDGSPFGLGHRSCFGQKLAVIQLKIFIATMSRMFFFKPVPSEVDSWEANVAIARQPKKCYVTLEPWDF